MSILIIAMASIVLTYRRQLCQRQKQQQQRRTVCNNRFPESINVNNLPKNFAQFFVQLPNFP